MINERSIMNRLDDIHYSILEEDLRLQEELERKSDEVLVEDIMYAMDNTAEISHDCESILNRFLHTNKLTLEERKKLQALFKLIYGKDAYGE